MVGSLPDGVLAAPHREAVTGLASGPLREIREETRSAGNGGTEKESGRGMEKESATVAFVIPGPAIGKGRPKFARRGNFVTAYTPEKTASYENLVKLAAHRAMNGRETIAVAVSCNILVEVETPASWSNKKRMSALSGALLPTSKPDLDNVAKGILDAMNDIVFKDDKQVVVLTVSKRYSEQSRASVEVVAL
jgi:Holliday junction resolvase RusA-like endonuclease